MLLAALSVCPKDLDQAQRLAAWIADLGGCKGHKLLLIGDTAIPATQISDLMIEFQRSFDSVELQGFVDYFHTWPEAPNACFAQAARHIEGTMPQPWLWLEPDTVPLKAGWLDTLWQEYISAKKPFLGDFVSVHTPELDVEDHCSGVAIYPGRMTKFAGRALIAGDTAFDVVAASQIVPHMHRSKHILHAWKHPEFVDWTQVEREIFAFKPEAVLFHASKDGSLIRLLRDRTTNLWQQESGTGNTNGIDGRGTTNGSETKKPSEDVKTAERRIQDASTFITSEEKPNASAISSVKAEPGSNPKSRSASLSAPTAIEEGTGQHSAPPAQTFDILIKSYPPDYERLAYCLRSIEKFASGFRQVVLVVPKAPGGSRESIALYVQEVLKDYEVIPPDKVPVKVMEVVENGEGYLMQQACKASAHEFTDADYILHMDSDCLLRQPITPQTFMQDGKPVWYMTAYSAIDVPWQPITEKFIGQPVDYEFMRRLPIMIPRAVHVALSAFCMANHGTRLTDYILSQPHRAFSEFNALGALAYTRARDDFHWVDTTREEIPPPVLLQQWSHAELTDEVRAEFEAILTGENNDQPTRASSDAAVRDEHHADYLDIGNPVQNEQPINPRIKQTPAGHWVLVDDTHISRWVEQHGSLAHDGQTMPLVLPEIPVGGVVVDAGAFIGDTTASFLERVGPTGRVMAFEPNPDAYACLQRNCPSAFNLNSALSDKPEIASLNLSENAGASHLSGIVGRPVHSLIDTVTLDSFELDRLDFLKADCEGCELSVLRGSEKTIEKFRPKMLIEVNEGALARQGTSRAELFTWLLAHGYRFIPIPPEIDTSDSPQFDILCTPVAVWNNRHIDSNWHNGFGIEPPATPEKFQSPPPAPWSDKAESLQRIRVLAEELRGYCTAPRLTQQVRKVLKEARVIK